MNGTKKIHHVETVVEAQPSSVALENEKRVTSLEEGQKDLVKSIGDIVVWIRKLEAGQEAIAITLNAKLDKLTNKPASTYLGAISIVLVMIGMCATLIMFVQDARLAPIRAQIDQIQKDDDEAFHQWVEDFSLLQRNDQVLLDRGLKGSVDAKEKKNYSQPKYPRSHGRPPS